MPEIVVPFAGVEGKTRLHTSPVERHELSLAMLGDVLDACAAIGPITVVTADPAARTLALGAGAAVMSDPGGGQAAAVQAVLAVLAGPVLIVNADLPCAEPDDLRALGMHRPVAALALVEAADGTTNALSLPRPDAFAPLYGPGSAARFRAHAAERGLVEVSLSIPNLVDDVDTLEDLHRLASRCGPRTKACLADLRVEVVQ